jgi:hypothetical protein
MSKHFIKKIISYEKNIVIRKNKMKKIILPLLCFIFLFTSSSFSQCMADDSVIVTLPVFDVSLNGQQTTSTYRKYPLIVYKNITYFPMTYYDARLLGLSTKWNKVDGLSVDKNEDYFYEYVNELNDYKNSNRQTAKIITSKIKVNGKEIDNTKEPYPLLLFRDVTYFPLTWRFAVDEFGWKYSFDNTNGLIIFNDNVIMKNPNTYKWSVNEYGGSGAGSMLGTDGMMFPIRAFYKHTEISIGDSSFEEENKRRSLGLASLALYSRSLEDVTIKESEQWQYRIYKIINNKEELVYKKIFPFYNGELNVLHYGDTNVFQGAFHSMEIPYWKEHMSVGNYIIRYIHPEKLEFTKNASNQLYSVPIEAPLSSADFYLESTVTINK